MFTAMIRKPNAVMLALFVSCSVMGMTMVTPAVPALRDDLGVSYNSAQLTITIYLLSIGIGQLFFGSLSDRFGRRPIFLIGSLLFCTSSLIGAIASTIELLIIARALQGLGAAALLTIGRVIVNDVYPAEKGRIILSTITAMQAVVPVIALATGGFVVDKFGWRGNMTILLIASIFVLIQALFLMGETNQNKLSRLKINDFTYAVTKVAMNPHWRYFTICAAVQVAIFQAMNGYMSYHFTRLGLSLSEFGLYYSVISFGYLIGNLVIRRTGHRFDSGFWVYWGSVLCVLLLVIMWALDATNNLTALRLSGLLSLVGFSHGLLIANAIIASLKGTGAYAGTANGMGGASHVLLGGAAGSLIILAGGATSFSVCMFITLAMALTSLWAASKARQLP